MPKILGLVYLFFQQLQTCEGDLEKAVNLANDFHQKLESEEEIRSSAVQEFLREQKVLKQENGDLKEKLSKVCIFDPPSHGWIGGHYFVRPEKEIRATMDTMREDNSWNFVYGVFCGVLFWGICHRINSTLK